MSDMLFKTSNALQCQSPNIASAWDLKIQKLGNTVYSQWTNIIVDLKLQLWQAAPFY